MRDNLDPFNASQGDAALWAALRQTGMAATVQALQVKLFATCLKHAKTQSDIQEMSCVLKLYVYLGRQTDTMSNVINFEHPSCGVVHCSLSSFGQPKPICMGSAVGQLLQVHRLMKCQTVLCSQHNAMRQQLQLRCLLKCPDMLCSLHSATS